jgi:hypothetical protein
LTALNPGNRSLLLECLRPPEGYRFDQAIATTYSLDLLALLTAPLAFTFFDWEEDDGEVTADPLALLEALRRHADRISLYCQAGGIKLPPATQRLTAYLERTIVEVQAPKGGVFHPKLWLLRYVSPTGPVRMRLVCLSRNLTFDRSWDTAVVLDGFVRARKNAYGDNHPIGEFIERLPGLATRPVGDSVRARAQQLAHEVRRAEWERPDGIDELLFWPLGLGSKEQWPFGGELARRPLLVMAPFLSDAMLKEVAERSKQATLISRPDQLGCLRPETLARFEKVYAFDPPQEDDPDAIGDRDAACLSGLHAKVYVIDDGWKARVFLGSANATTAAFNRNVEFLVELAGRKSEFGIDRLLGREEGKQTGLIDLLQPWSGHSVTPTAEELETQKLDDELEELRCAIAAVPLAVTVSVTAPDQFSLQIAGSAVAPALNGATLACWPITLRAERAIDLTSAPVVKATFDGLSLDALTGFVAFELTKQTSQGAWVSKRFACTAAITGMPADRLDRLLAAILTDREHLMRLLWLLLEAQGGLLLGGDPNGGSAGVLPWQSAAGGYPVFERMLRALAGDPARLKEIGRLIEDLSRTPEGARLLPTGLVSLWQAVQGVANEASA